MADTIRIGRISAVNYAAGMVRVVYADRDNSVTKEIPLLSFEYMMPEVEDMVAVCHLSNGTVAGVLMGRPWSNVNVPPEGYKGLYRKDLSRTAGKAMIRYDDETSEIRIHGDVKIKIDGGTVEVDGGTVNITGDAGDVVVSGVSLVHHTHSCPDGGTGQPG